tara:strand:- start:398 stop:673 length:276 start_codon:yes stop_codon:yes gene_type:complete
MISVARLAISFRATFWRKNSTGLLLSHSELLQLIVHDFADLAFAGTTSGAASCLLLKLVKVGSLSGGNGLPDFFFRNSTADADIPGPHHCI